MTMAMTAASPASVAKRGRVFDFFEATLGAEAVTCGFGSVTTSLGVVEGEVFVASWMASAISFALLKRRSGLG